MSSSVDHPVSYIFPWDEAKQRLYGWELLITWLAFGCVVNAIQLLLHSLIKQLRKQHICRIIIWLSSIDFTFDAICLVQCTLNYHFKQFFGEQAFCTAQAFWAELLMAMSGFSIGCTLLASYMAIIHNRVLTTKEIDRLHLGALLYCLILSVLGSIAPGQGTLNSSGLFCYTASQHVAEGVLFHIGYILPLISTLVYLWYRMYQRVRDMTKFLAKRKLNIEARKGQVRMAKRMAWYIYILLLCFLPYEFAVWYSWVTGKHPPFQMWITFGMFGHVLTVASPILYYVLNQSARHIVYRHLYRIFCRRPMPHTENTRRGSRSGTQTLNSATSPQRKGLIDAAQIEELTKALSNSSLLNQMLAFADDRYCSEPILFWIDVQVWKTMCSKIYTPQTSERVLSSSAHALLASHELSSSHSPTLQTTPSFASRDRGNSSNVSSPAVPNRGNSNVSSPAVPDRGIELSDLRLPPGTEKALEKAPESKEVIEQGDIEELRDFATSVYLTYFIRGGEISAPLELNVGDEIISRVVRDLKVQDSKDGHRCMVEHTPELKNLFEVAEQESLRLLHDNVYRPFCRKIQMDDVLANQARLKNLHSGDILPWSGDDVEDMELGSSRSAFDSTQVILPKGGGGAGGVSTRKKKKEEQHEREESVSAPEHSVSRSANSGASLGGLPEIYHVGIDNSSGFKLLFKEGGSFSVTDLDEKKNPQLPSHQQKGDLLPPTPRMGASEPNFEETSTIGRENSTNETDRELTSTPSLSALETTLPSIDEDLPQSTLERESSV